jgi:predicted DsbA family dithiol-disulfide isomerase
MADESAERPIAIDIVSDVVCPWCFVGKRKLDKALEAFAQTPIEIRWRPFQLDPTIPPGGVDRKAYLEGKFRDPARIAEIHHRLEETGRELGIAFAFDKITRSPNTLDAHRLIRWAHSVGRQSEVKEDLFRLYFVEGVDIGDRDVLAHVGAANGLDGTLVARLLEDGSDIAAVEDEIASAVRLGVSGVPFFIFDSKFAVPGAQQTEVLVAAINKAREDTAAVRSA